MSYTEHPGSGTTPKTSDSERMLLVKILLAATGGGVGGSGAVYEGSGNPNGVVAAPIGSIYSDITGGVVVAQYTKLDASLNTGWG